MLGRKNGSCNRLPAYHRSTDSSAREKKKKITYTLHPPHARTHFRTRQNCIQSIFYVMPGAPPREAHKHTGWAGLFLLLDSSSSLVKTAVTTVRKHILHILEIKKTCNNSADTPRPARALDAPLMIQSAR